LDEEAWCLVVRDPLQLQKQERSNDGEEEKEEEDGHTEEPRAPFMSLPLLANSCSSSSSFLFSGNRAIGNSSILRQANEEFQKKLQQQLQEKDSSISPEDAKREKERERERERRSSCCPISQNLFYQAPHIFFEQALSEASLLSRLFVYLLVVVVAIVDRPRLDLCVLFWSV
jgi:hypothetical protein